MINNDLFPPINLDEDEESGMVNDMGDFANVSGKEIPIYLLPAKEEVFQITYGREFNSIHGVLDLMEECVEQGLPRQDKFYRNRVFNFLSSRFVKLRRMDEERLGPNIMGAVEERYEGLCKRVNGRLYFDVATDPVLEKSRIEAEEVEKREGIRAKKGMKYTPSRVFRKDPNDGNIVQVDAPSCLELD